MDILTELLTNVLSSYYPEKDEDIEKYDLSNEDDYNTFVKAINELKNDPLFGYIIKPISDDILKAAYEQYGKKFENKEKKIDTKSNPQKQSKIDRKVIDHSEEIDEPDRPSNHVSVDQGLKIHKIVGEYVDTMIKPYYKGNNPNVINDAYAGLYEFACWIMNR